MTNTQNHKLNLRAVIVPIVISVILILLKSYGWIKTDSVSLLSSLLDSSLDSIISLLNLMAVIYAAKPADAEHSFGHNAIEDIVGLVQASFIAASGLFLIYEAIDRFITPRAMPDNDIGILVIVISMVGTLAIVIYQKMIVKKTDSIIVEADSLHYQTDFLVNGAIIIALLLSSNSKYLFVDPLIAIIIAAYIFTAAFKIGRTSFNHLMDHSLSDEKQQEIIKVIKKQKDISGYHALKTRRSGSRIFIQMHIEIDKKFSLVKAHNIADDLEEALETLYPETEVIIHKDPV